MKDVDQEKKDEEGKEAKKEEEKKEVEPDKQDLKNPSRVIPIQEKKIMYPDNGKYYPVLDTRFSGFVVLRLQIDDGAPEAYYDDEERDMDAPNPDLQTDIELPAEFEFDPAVQNAP